MPYATYADVLRPAARARALAYDLALALAGAVLLAASAQLALWIGPVPITAQTFAVVLLGALLGSRRGTAAVAAYLAEGAAGLPVFASGGASLAYIAGPTGGYLVGFLPAAWIAGRLAERGWDRRFLSTVAAMAAATALIYVTGAAWLSTYVGPRAALTAGVLPFLPGDLAKVLLAAAALPAGWKLLGKGA